MTRFVWAQVVGRPGRTITLGAGILVAAVTFTLLTSVASTSELQVRGMVERNFRPAYDILVRPEGSFGAVERQQGLIQDNHLSGIFGGISFEQYHEIRDIPGVEIAAPIANIGFIMPFEFVPITINRFLTADPVQLYRLRLQWVANSGASRYPDSAQYVYYETRHPFRKSSVPGGIVEVGGHTRAVPVCDGFIASHPEPISPFALSAGSGLMCFSARTPDVQGGLIDYGPLRSGRVGSVSTVFFPILLAAIDPTEE